MSAHALYAPSSANRWLYCSASLDKHVNTTSPAAEEGQERHAIAEMILRKRQRGEDITALLAEAPDSVLVYTDYVRNFERFACYIEQTVPVYTDQCFGTIDFLAYDAERDVLHVIDFKSGIIPVNTIYNEQLLLYACGALNLLALDYRKATVAPHIVQPRCNNIACWEAYPDELADVLLRVSHVVDTNEREYAPSDTVCKYCSYRNSCEARLTQRLIELTKDL